jgi:signal transduction histidine kinase
VSQQSSPGLPQVAGKILVVDDQEPNRLLLTEILGLSGHQSVAVATGLEAISMVAEWEPDLVLLDVHMPGMDGFEVCRRLRGNPATASLPIILVTSLDHREHRLIGIAAGANDYLTKPIDRTDLILRVRNALYMRRLHQEVAEQYRTLRRLEEQRDSMVHMIAHDLRTPLTGITAYVELAENRLAKLGITEVLSDLRQVRESGWLLTEMVSDMLDVSRLEAGAMPIRREAVDLRRVVREAIAGVRWAAGEVEIDFPEPAEGVSAFADPSVIRRVTANLVGNAAKYTPKQERVRVELGSQAAGPVVRVIDRGPGIPPEFHERIFEKFGQVEGGVQVPGRSTGLGLTFCRLAIEAHGGRIGLESAVGAGSTFWFELPTASSAA